jgi:hypothetical protein
MWVGPHGNSLGVTVMVNQDSVSILIASVTFPAATCEDNSVNPVLEWLLIFVYLRNYTTRIQGRGYTGEHGKKV